MTLFFLTIIICLIQYCLSFTNSSGQYLTPSIRANHSNSISCHHSILCYANCIGSNKKSANQCANLTMIMHSQQVIINCINCDYLTVYADNATNFTMQYNSSSGGEFHIQNVKNVFIDYLSVDNSIIYAQFAEIFNFNHSDGALNNIFYLDYVSKEINFRSPIHNGYHSTSFRYNTIVASNAYQFNFYTAYYSFYYNIIYCPYNNVGACHINGNYPSVLDLQIFVPSTTLNADMFTFNFTTQSIYITLWCNMNDNGIYQSYTDIHYDHTTQQFQCTNITSECCFMTEQPTNKIICQDDVDDICSIDCSDDTLKCNNSNIYPSNSTKYMHVICNGRYNCFNTYIYCPETLESTCQIVCGDVGGCEYTVIRSNTNNKDIFLNCTKCGKTQVFVDQVQSFHQSVNTHANIICKDTFACNNVGITVNAPINNLNVICQGEWGCDNMDIKAPETDNILLYCSNNSYSCKHINLRGRTDIVDAITIECNNPKSCRDVNVFTTLEYKLDYLSVEGASKYYSVTTVCDYSEQKSLIYNSSCYDSSYPYIPNGFCCPLSNIFEDEIYCDDRQNCSIILETNHQPIIIYANTANSLSILCTNCSFVNIFAINANNVEIECTEKCNDIHLNAMYVKDFKLNCNDECFNLVIDVTNVMNAIIDANTLYKTQIYAHNGNNFNLICSNCSEMELSVPSDYQTFIYCANDYACSKFNIYNNKWNEYISMNITITNCYNAIYEMDSYWINQFQWTLFCPSTVKFINDNTYCKWHPRLQNTFCKCGHILNDTQNIYLNITSYQPFSHKCYDSIQSPFQTFHIVVGTLFVIVSFLIIIFWSIIGLKYIFLKYFNPLKYHKVKNIEPPSPYILNYIHLFDVLMWIFNIYIVVISYGIYFYADQVCSMNEKPFNWKEICLNTSLCDTHNNECVSNASIEYIWIVAVISICITVLANLCSLCIGDEAVSGFFHISHFICLQCFQKTKWNHYYLNRTFFPVSSGHWKLILLYNIWGRYLMLFISSLLTLYIGYNDGDFSIGWYDI
eukprot:339799_1